MNCASAAELLANWKQIVFENNREINWLNEVLLTDGEIQQITAQRTPLKLNAFNNGKTVAITRDTRVARHCSPIHSPGDARFHLFHPGHAVADGVSRQSLRALSDALSEKISRFFRLTVTI